MKKLPFLVDMVGRQQDLSIFDEILYSSLLFPTDRSLQKQISIWAFFRVTLTVQK